LNIWTSMHKLGAEKSHWAGNKVKREDFHVQKGNLGILAGQCNPWRCEDVGCAPLTACHLSYGHFKDWHVSRFLGHGHVHEQATYRNLLFPLFLCTMWAMGEHLR
jgi:hypothetical protein